MQRIRGGEKIKFADELQFESELANSVCFSISGIIKNKKIDFIKDEVIGINTDTRSVILATDQALEYEHCVLAFGSDAAHYDVEGAGGTVIGTPDFVVAVHAGTAAAGTPTFQAARDIVFGPYGRQLNGGLTYLWANAATGTVAFTGNAIVDITLSKVT